VAAKTVNLGDQDGLQGIYRIDVGVPEDGRLLWCPCY